MKRIILSLFALVATGAATAQEEEYSRWSVTPKAGLTVATVVGDDTQENSSSMAWAAGLEASLRPGRLLSFDFGMFYTRDRIKEEGQINYPNGNQFNFTASHFRLVTERLDMPLLLGLHVMPGLTLKAGVQPSLLMSATSKYHFAGFYVEPPLNAIYTDADLANLPKIQWTGMRRQESRARCMTLIYASLSAQAMSGTTSCSTPAITSACTA